MGMGEFSVNTDRIKGIADLLDQQAGKLENAGDSVDSIKNSLSIEGSARASVASAMRTLSSQVREEGNAARKMGSALRSIANSYRTTETKLAGKSITQGAWAAVAASAGAGWAHTCPGMGGDHGSLKGWSEAAAVFSSDPVNLNTGNFILDNEDMEIPGLFPLRLRRFYNSQGAFTGMMGRDWNIGFEKRLTESADYVRFGADVCVFCEDGREEYFARTKDGEFRPATGTSAELKKTQDGYRYETLEGEVSLFDADGRYVRQENAHHVGFHLLYADDRLLKVERDSGEFFAFSYDETGLLSSVTDHTGRTCTYQFENGQLVSVVLPDGAPLRYFYNEQGKIRRVLTPRMASAVETEYDAQFRVTYQRFADGTTNKFEYRDEENAVVMTERNGSQSIHIHDERYRNIRNIYTDGEERFEYNTRGLKTVLTDRLGNVTRLTYDDRGNITGILRPDKTKLAATYDRQNRLLTLSVNGKRRVQNRYNEYGDLLCAEDGLGRRTTYSYNGQGQVTEICTPGGNVVKADYDEHGNLVLLKNPDGGLVRLSYDALNRRTALTDPLGHTSGASYDVCGRVTAEVRPDGRGRSYEYDAQGNVTVVTDYDGSMTTAVYNENGRPVSVMDAAGRQTSYEYDAMWNIARTVLPGGAAVGYLYNAENRLETLTDPLGNQTHYRYDAMGNVVGRTEPDGTETAYEWDAEGRCTGILTADGGVTEYGYDADGRIIYMKDAGGTERFRTFDEAGQLTLERDSLGHTRSYSYHADGNLASVTDEKGRTTTYSYAPGAGQPEAVCYPDGTAESRTYDANGNLKSRTDIFGNTLRYSYDELDRLTEIRDAGGNTQTYSYDLCGRVLAEKDFEGSVTRYTYSAAGQLETVTDALGNVTRYQYDEMDGLTEILREIPGADPVRIRYERDPMGRLVRLTDALGESESYVYDACGRMTEKVDREDGHTCYAYDAAGLLASVRWADGKEASYRYDRMHRMTQVEDWTGVTRIAYDGQGHPTEITYPDQKSLRFGYDERGNRIRAEYPDGAEVLYAYDELSRLKSMTQGGYGVHYTYNEHGQVAGRTMTDGNEVRYGYDARGYVSRMTQTDAEGILDDFRYGYDALGRRRTQGVFRRDAAEQNGAYAYTYDPAGRLLAVTRDGNALREYAYDAVGNRSSLRLHGGSGTRQLRYEYDLRGAVIRKLGDGVTEEYGYDRRGNLTSWARNGKVFREYGYDAANRLARAAGPDGAAEYLYNGLGYRTGMKRLREGAESLVSYRADYSQIYDNLLERTEGADSRSWFWGLGLESTAAAGAHSWYTADGQGSVLRRTGEAGFCYDEFGVPEGDTQAEEFGYHGFLFDTAAGTYFAQARQYRSETGAFDAMDRIGGDITAPDTLLPYAYCANEPLNRTDKSGYWFGLDDAVAAGIGAIGGAAGQLFGDVVTYATTGEWESSWQDYTGAAIGGAAGGVASLYVGPVAAAAISSGTSTLTKEGLKKATIKDYDKSWGEIAVDTAVDAGTGAAFAFAGDLAGKGIKKLANTKLVKSLTSKLSGGGTISKFIASQIQDTATGKGSRWSQLKKIIKNQHESIAKSPELKKKLIGILAKSAPLLIGEKVLEKFLENVNPKEILLDKAKGGVKDKLKEWIKEKLGLIKNGKASGCGGLSAAGAGAGGGGVW